jgi:hypothetical protein
MQTFSILMAFFVGGALFGAWLPVTKFMALSVIVTVAYFAALALLFHSTGGLLGKGLAAFFCIQLGYVAGLGLATALRAALQKTADANRTDKLKARNKTFE